MTTLSDLIWEHTTLDREWCDNLAKAILDAGYAAPDPAPLDVERLVNVLDSLNWRERARTQPIEEFVAIVAAQYAKEPQP